MFSQPALVRIAVGAATINQSQIIEDGIRAATDGIRTAADGITLAAVCLPIFVTAKLFWVSQNCLNHYVIFQEVAHNTTRAVGEGIDMGKPQKPFLHIIFRKLTLFLATFRPLVLGKHVFPAVQCCARGGGE